MKIHALGIDLGKTVFHLVGLDERGKEPSKPVILLGRAALVHGLFFASRGLFAALVAQRPWPKAFISAVLAYSFIYGYGLASITVFAATLRGIPEHQLEKGELSSTGRAALRNFSRGLVVRLIFGAYGFPNFIPKHRYWGELMKLAKQV
jgi:hypothetical protein